MKSLGVESVSSVLREVICRRRRDTKTGTILMIAAAPVIQVVKKRIAAVVTILNRQHPLHASPIPLMVT
jgi:predicted CopG family antitoxin